MFHLLTTTPFPAKKRRRFFGRVPKARSTFTTFMDEGFIHYRTGHFRKALYCFDRAIDLQPNNKKALVSRSQCHLKLGDAASALKDAQASFDNKNTYINGLFQYSEALYNLGQFEKALIAYYRGFRLRRDVEGFRIGVQKCTKAILSAIGNRSATQMEDLDEMLPLIKELEYINSNQVIHCCIRPGIGEGKVHVQRKSILKPPSKARQRWVAREMLSELYFDKNYLSKFLRREDVKSETTTSGNLLRNHAREALNYLSIREDFWRQMNPMYTKKEGLNFNNKMVHQYELEEKKRQEANRKIKMDAALGALRKNIATIEHAISINRPKDSFLECGRTIRQIKDISNRLLPTKREYICLLLHYRGISELMMKNYDGAIGSFQKELEYTIDQKMPDVKARALDCLGKAFVKKNFFMEAADAWETRLIIVKNPIERAYMYHELGHCYLGIKKLGLAKNYAGMAIDEAAKINDNIWLMNSYFFLAKVQIKEMSLDDALFSMETALKYCEKLKDKPMTKKLTEACNCIKTWIEKNATEKYEREQALLRQIQKQEEEEEELRKQQEADGHTDDNRGSVLSGTSRMTSASVAPSVASVRPKGADTMASSFNIPNTRQTIKSGKSRSKTSQHSHSSL